VQRSRQAQAERALGTISRSDTCPGYTYNRTRKAAPQYFPCWPSIPVGIPCRTSTTALAGVSGRPHAITTCRRASAGYCTWPGTQGRTAVTMGVSNGRARTIRSAVNPTSHLDCGVYPGRACRWRASSASSFDDPRCTRSAPSSAQMAALVAQPGSDRQHGVGRLAAFRRPAIRPRLTGCESRPCRNAARNLGIRR